MCAIIILFVLPLFSTPWLIRELPQGDDTAKILVQIYPFYTALSGWLAYKAYPQRHYVTWLLLAVMSLTTAAIFTLVTS